MASTIHSSEFDVRGLFTLSTSINAITNTPSVICPIKLRCTTQGIVDVIQIPNPAICIKVSTPISALANSPTPFFDDGRVDVHVSCIVHSPIIRLNPTVPSKKTIEFGAFVFSHASRESPDQISIDVDEKFAMFGVKEPKIYTRKISIVAESVDFVEYDTLLSLVGLRRTLSVYGVPYNDVYISNISDMQRKAGLEWWVWHVEFYYHQFESVDAVNIDGLNLPTVISISEEQISPIIDDRCFQAGISEPIAYSISRQITYVDFHGETASQLKTRIGKSVSAILNEDTYDNCRITKITRYSPKGGGLISIFDVEIQKYQYNISDVVSFGTINLSHPIIPNAFDITPEYSVDMSAGFSFTTPIPVITRRYAFDCLTESQTEFNNIIAAIETKQTLTINGSAIPLCYITSLSALQPRGGGNVWKYTIEFSKREGEMPITATFNGISLPNCTSAGDEELEIISSRTVLHSGKTAANIGVYTSKRFTFQCMSNNKTVYNQLVALIGSKYTLVVDGETVTKAYISSWSNARKIGTGTNRLYTWVIGFEQETA